MCNGRRTVSVLIGVALLSLTAGTALAGLPADRVAEYYIRETPTDPQSDIVFIVALELTAVSQDGDEIAWKTTQMTRTEPGYGGARDIVWVDEDAEPDTPDAFWWVEHADPETPQDAEFDQPPAFLGTAAAVEPTDGDLDYDFAGEFCDTACKQLFSGEVGALTYTFRLVSEEEPEAEGDDEPVEIEGDVIPT